MRKQSKRKPLAQWQLEDAERLRARFDAQSLSQQEFGGALGIGSQGAVWQYLNGKIALNLPVAIKFARGLGCSVEDISPTLAAQLPDDQGARVLSTQQPLALYSVTPDDQARLLALFDQLTPPQQRDMFHQLEAAVQANIEIVRQLGGRLRVVREERAAEKLPPAPKSKV